MAVAPTWPRSIETLEIGDLLLTKDNGIQAIRWIGRKVLEADALRAAPHLRPITIRKDALGVGVPERDIEVSPQHRILLNDAALSMVCGRSEVLAPAKGLVDGQRILIRKMRSVEYIHLLFDSHEIVFTEGLASESFQPGSVGIESVDAAARAELFELFPQLQYGLQTYGPSVRPSLTVRETRSLVQH